MSKRKSAQGVRRNKKCVRGTEGMCERCRRKRTCTMKKEFMCEEWREK